MRISFPHPIRRAPDAVLVSPSYHTAIRPGLWRARPLAQPARLRAIGRHAIAILVQLGGLLARACTRPRTWIVLAQPAQYVGRAGRVARQAWRAHAEEHAEQMAGIGLLEGAAALERLGGGHRVEQPVALAGQRAAGPD